MLASTNMIEHFFSQKKGNMSVEQQEINTLWSNAQTSCLKYMFSCPKYCCTTNNPFSLLKGEIVSGRSRGGGGGGGPPPPPPGPPLFLDQTEAQRAKKTFFWDCPPPPPLISGSGWPGLPLYLKAWIHHWLFGSALINSYKRFRHSA